MLAKIIRIKMNRAMGAFSRVVPWRIKRFMAYNFPLAYACTVNGGIPRQGLEDGLWLEKLWDEPKWNWPKKNNIILDLTKEEDRILDLGTGTGSILRFLRTQGYLNLAAMDAAAYPIERLKELRMDARQGILPTIPFETGTFDFVIASQVLEHIIARDRFLREIDRVLCPGGRAAIFVPDWCLTPADEPSHVAVYNIASLSALLRKHFVVQRVESLRDENHEVNVLFALVQKKSAL